MTPNIFWRVVATLMIIILAIPHSALAAQSDVVNAVNQIRLSDPNVPVGTPNPRGLMGNIIDNMFYPIGPKQGKIRPEYLDITMSSVAGTLIDLSSQGTTGYLPKYTGTGIALGNSAIFESGGNIGIGTASPSYKLDVVGTINASALRLPNGAGLGMVLTSDASGLASWQAGGWALSGNTGTNSTTNFIGTTDNQSLVFKVNGTNAGIIGNTTNNNTYFGLLAGSVSSINRQNVGIGNWALQNNTSGNMNSATGYQALFSNTSGRQNVANGYQALYTNNGFKNTATGYQALFSNTAGTANNNTAMGSEALYSNTTASSNTAVGASALYSNTVGSNNTAIGDGSLRLNTSGLGNTANGSNALWANTTGTSNVAIGYNSLSSNNIGTNNVANGANALSNNTQGDRNISIGSSSLTNSSIGNNNVAVGASTLYFNTSGNSNVAVGYQTLRFNTTGNNNTALGINAGSNITAGSSNITIGNNAQVASVSADNQLSIGNWIYGTSGNIGIGTSAPGAKLDVSGTINATTSVTAPTFIGNLTGNATTASSIPWSGVTGKPTTISWYGITDAVDLTSSQFITGTKSFQSNKWSGSYLGANNSYWLQAYSSDGWAAALSFHRLGLWAINLGLDPDNVLRIGGWSAASNRWQLDMSGNQTVAGSMTAGAWVRALGGSAFNSTNGYSFATPGDTDGGMFSPSDGNLVLATNNAERFRIDSSGNIGIGTSASGAKLDINGNARIAGNSNYTLPIATSSDLALETSTTNRRFLFWWNLEGYSLQSTELSTNNPMKMALNPLWGNVGIGIATPSYKLDVNGTVNATAFRGDGSTLTALNPANISVGTAGINISGNAATATLSANSTLVWGIIPSNFHRNDAAWDWRMASATNNSGYATAALKLREHNFAWIQTGVASESPRIAFHWQWRVASQIGIGTDGVIRTFDNPGTGYENFAARDITANGNIIANGNIGIGTSSPSARLDVNGWVRTLWWSLFNATNGYTFGWSWDTDGGMFSPADGNLVLATDNVERIRINNVGNIGIGTITPSYKLDVSGTINASALRLPNGAGAGKVLRSDASGNATWESIFDSPPQQGSILFAKWLHFNSFTAWNSTMNDYVNNPGWAASWKIDAAGICQAANADAFPTGLSSYDTRVKCGRIACIQKGMESVVDPGVDFCTNATSNNECNAQFGITVRCLATQNMPTQVFN